jgi:uncharacterized protein
MLTSQQIIDQTQKWILDVVVGCNFCPFAARVVKLKKIHYEVEFSTAAETCIESVLKELNRLDNNVNIETSFLIFPYAFIEFDDFLDLVFRAEKLLRKNGYEGIYQLASFHPLYLFAHSADNDAANYTNRSLYPMLHLLREASIDSALERYENPEDIPKTNIHFARQQGLATMKRLRDACITNH